MDKQKAKKLAGDIAKDVKKKVGTMAPKEGYDCDSSFDCLKKYDCQQSHSCSGIYHGPKSEKKGACGPHSYTCDASSYSCESGSFKCASWFTCPHDFKG